MLEFRNGALHLFKAFDINVFVHWTWFVIAYFFLTKGVYGMSPTWGMATYIGLFVIVLLHEFGHALACRSVGGQARMIMLWPLGGVAFVSPPPRPGAVLWSIAAGPLVNVVLVPVSFVAVLVLVGTTEQDQMSGFQEMIFMLSMINLGLLIFNMLPIYPLDGGQILQAILWFFIGRARSLRVAAIIGLICTVPLGILCLVNGNLFGIVIAVFIGWQAWKGYRAANYLARHEVVTNPWERGG